MKKLTAFLFLVFFTLMAFPQEQQTKQKVSSTYDRSSLTVYFMDNQSEDSWSLAKAKFPQLTFSDKFNNNNLESLVLPRDFKRKLLGDYEVELKETLNERKVGKNIVSLWYNRQSDGTMDMDRVHERGRFTATDADFLLAQTSKRGNAALEDFGNRLIDLSYIIVLDLNTIVNVGLAEDSKLKGWTAKVTGYLYKLDFNDEVRANFYDTWVYDDDSEADRVSKLSAFDTLTVPIQPIQTKQLVLTATQSKDETLSLFIKPKSEDELMQDLVQKAYDEVIFHLEKTVEDFKVKTPLYETKPLRAKIGLKEGLSTDSRFFVYEYVYDERTEMAKPKRRGVIRAASKSKIVDNRQEATGDMGTSQFYQVGGRKLEEGFLLQQQNDLGMELMLGYEIGGIGGVFGRLDLRMGRYIGIRSLFVYVEGGFDAGDYYSAALYPSALPVYDYNFQFLRYGGGIAKGFQLGANIEVRPYVGVGLDNASQSELESEYAPSALYFKPGINLALNLTHNFQLMGGVGAHIFITNAESDNYGDIAPWPDIFEGREGVSGFIGFKVGF